MVGFNRMNVTVFLISLAVHVAVLAMPMLFRNLGPGQAGAGAIMVELTKFPVTSTEPDRETKNPEKPVPPTTNRAEAAARFKEETVTLGSRDGRYRDYLKRVKGRIDSRWKYPGQSFERGERGITTVKFSIDSDGTLTQSAVVTSSGYHLLDECALNVIRAAAPYDPLPRAFNISRLNIVASFHYHLTH